MKTGSVRKVRCEDLALLFEWRRDKTIAKWMANPPPESFTDHLRWYHKMAENIDNHQLIYEIDGVKLGYASFTPTDHSLTEFEWGIYAKPDAVSGTGSKIARSALSYFFQSYPFSVVRAKIISTNQRSISLHRRIGFIETQINSGDEAELMSEVDLYLDKQSYENLNK